jgi:UDP-glucose 4-epimerase
MAKLIDNPGAFGQVFNVGHTKEISIYDLALLIKDRTKSTSEIVYKPYEEVYEAGFEDMPRRLPDISKIQKLIGYQPTRDLGGMLESIIEHERVHLEARV